MGDELLVYGAYGYTGTLIARHAADEGRSPSVAGRTAAKVERLATELGFDHRVFGLEQPSVVERQLADFDAVLNCAGPFAETADPLIEACLATGTDYLDITGRIDVLESTAARDEAAADAGVTLLPAVGFDVVVTDCLAAYLARRLDSATRLRLALDGLASFSPGTIKSIIGGLSTPGAIRRHGEIRSVPPAYETRRFDFGAGPTPAVTIPWGDVATAYYTTGIENVTTYAAVPKYAVPMLRTSRPLAGLLGAEPTRRALTAIADAVVSGPTPAERARHSVRVYGEVEDDAGDRAGALLRTPDPYDVTAETAVACARRVDEVAAGFRTPGMAFGPDFPLGFEGIDRDDADDRAIVETDE
ncbi:saccharopine dehydrogenase [Halobacteriales archaeon QS_1_67_19]|nr:MAG: saccharopine dehydrogenase [Halobacteriales archaeon QS_1_67_19]